MVFGLVLFLTIYGPLVTPRDAPDESLPPDVEVMALNEDMIRFLGENIKSDIPERMLHELVSAIFDKGQLNLTYDNVKTRTAIETFETRNGNCLSFTNMFVAMARHIGLEAYFQEVFILPTWNKKGEMVFLSRHINAVVAVPGRAMEIDFNPWSNRRSFSSALVPDHRALAQYYNNIGAEFFATTEYSKAIPWFYKAIATDPSLSFAWSNLGVAYRKNNQYHEAEQSYLRALELNKREYTAMTNLARLYETMGRERDASRWVKKAERFRNQNPYYHYGLGNQAVADGKWQEAVDHYKRAIRRKNKEHEFHFALAKVYAHLGQVKKAADSLEKAKKFAPDIFNQDKYSQKLEGLASLN